MMRAVFVLFAFAGPLAAFPVPKAARTPDFVGTTWTGMTTWAGGGEQKYEVRFGDDGTLHYLGDASAKCTWTWDGTTLAWQINNYSHWQATFNSGVLEGRGSNTPGDTAVTRLTRAEK